MQNYKELLVWQKAMDLTEEVYRLTKLLPKEEIFVLSDQLRRAAVSVASNIAEGYGRNAMRDFVRFLGIAKGSLFETETQLIMCVRLGFLTSQQIQKALDLSDEIGKMINALSKKLTP